MIKIDMWYGDKVEEVERLDFTFYPNAGEYRGNLYIGFQMVGDYVCNDSVELENAFPQLHFNWD